jgi:hypothetical protein
MRTLSVPKSTPATTLTELPLCDASRAAFAF